MPQSVVEDTLRKRIVFLEDRVSLLEEQNVQLSELLKVDTWVPPVALKLNKAESRVMGLLFHHTKPLTKCKIIDLLYWDVLGKDHPDSRIINVLICRIRKKLKPYNLEVKTVWGQGFYLPDTTRQTLHDWPTLIDRV